MKLILSFLLFATIFSLQTEFLKYDEEDNIGILYINKPQTLNALNSLLLDELDQMLFSIDTNKIRALIITGEGEKSFVAGADISEMSEYTKDLAQSFSKRGNYIFRKLETFPIPVISAINGFALGGGLELALSCDIRICSENAIFGQPEVSLGITPGFGGTQRLPRIIGVGMAKQLIYTAKNIKADDALKIGLVNAIYPQNELLNEAKKLALTIAKNGSNAIKNSKKAINEGMNVDIEKGIKIEEELFGNCFETPEQIERMKNFLEKGKKSDKKDEKKDEKKSNLQKKEESSDKKDQNKSGELVPTNKFKGMHFLKEFTTPNMPCVLSAGDKNSYNSMIIGWGLIGAAWQKPLFIVYVKPDRYTYQFMEKTTYFTVNFIRKDLYKKFVPYGNKSGRDINKEEVSGVHIQFLDNGGITFEEAEEVYVCKMMAKAHFEHENLAPEIVEFYEKASTAFNQSKEPHGIYIGEIIEHYKRN